MLTLPHPLVLASASPRRKEILEMVGLDFEVMPSQYEEPSHSDHLTDPEEFANMVALGKGQEVFDRLDQKSLVLSADTIGVIGDTVLEKPLDRDDAKRMIQLMSGKDHQVLTTLALFVPGRDEALQQSVWTKVFFREIDEEEIEKYLDTAEYMDKAAAYAIQGEASIFVESIEGDFFNVVGLPISTLWSMMKSL